MSLVLDLVASDSLDFDTAVRLTRAVGHTMARLADWQVSTLSHRVEQLERAGQGERVAADHRARRSCGPSSRRSSAS